MTFTLACAKAPAAISPDLAPDPLQQLATDINSAINAPGVQRGLWGIAVQSIDRGDTLFSLNPDQLFVPASTAKLIALAAAAQAVGWDYRYETVVRASGPIVDGVLRGDLIVTGSGDPTIGGRGGQEITAFVDVLRNAGIRRVDGRVIGDDNALEEPRPQLAWAWDDLGYSTGAIFGALNFAENRIEATVIAGQASGTPAAVHVPPQAAYRPLDNRVVTGPAGSPQLIWPEQRPGVPFLTIAGSIPTDAKPARLLISAGNPTFWFAATLRHALLTSGIEVIGDAWDIDDVSPPVAVEPGQIVYTYRSAPLGDIARHMMKDSINLYGEAALRLARPAGAFPTNDAALEGVRAILTQWGITRDAWQVVDGSGLSRRDAVSPAALLAVLRRMYEPTGASPWMASLPIGGRDGTLVGRLMGTPAEGNIRAKTGTMSNVRTLAGYARTGDGESVAFAIMVNNFEGSGAEAVAAIDRIAVALAGFTRVPRQ